MIVGAAPTDPVGLATVTQDKAARCHVGRNGEHQRPVGHQSAAADHVKGQYIRIAQAASAALIGPAAIDEAITNHPRPAFQRRRDQLFDVIGPRCGKQQRFGPRAPAIAFVRKEQRADRLCARRASRLTRRYNLQPARAQGLGQKPRLRRLANALAALKRDEPPAGHSPTTPSVPSRIRASAPPLAIEAPATSGSTCTGSPGTRTSRLATVSPFAIGALIGPL